MKVLVFLGLASLAVASAHADYSYAADELANRTQFAGTTARPDVQQELTRATASGDLIGMHGAPFNRMSPAAYPPKPQPVARARGDVQAELAQAIQVGDMPAANESGLTLREMHPAVYAGRNHGPAGPVLARAGSDTELAH